MSWKIVSTPAVVKTNTGRLITEIKPLFMSLYLKHLTHLHILTINILFSQVKIDKASLYTIKLASQHYPKSLSSSSIKYTFFCLSPGSRHVYFWNKTQTKYTSHFSEAVTESQKHDIKLQRKYTVGGWAVGADITPSALTDWRLKQESYTYN